MNNYNELLEKAKEIFCEHCLNKGWDKCKETCKGYKVGVLKLQEIAEWKDEQYKIKIDELINFIKDHCFESVFRNTLIIEDFDNVDELIDKIKKVI